MASLTEIVAYLDAELRPAEIPDHAGALNGLQLSNPGAITHVAGAVDYSLATIRKAVDRKADLLILHHGMFWTDPLPLTGLAYERLEQLTRHGIAVYGSHIPLDMHPTFGNNVLFARELGLEPTGGFAQMRGISVGVSGTSDIPTPEHVERAREFSQQHGHHLVTTPVTAAQRTKRWGI